MRGHPMHPPPPDFDQNKNVLRWREDYPRHAWALDQMRPHHRVKNAIKNYLYDRGRLPYETMDLLWEFATRIEWRDEVRPYAPPTQEQRERECWNRSFGFTDDQRKI